MAQIVAPDRHVTHMSKMTVQEQKRALRTQELVSQLIRADSCGKDCSVEHLCEGDLAMAAGSHPVRPISTRRSDGKTLNLTCREPE